MPLHPHVLSLLLTLGASASADESPAEVVAAYFQTAQDACNKDGGKLWGASLCGPWLVADFDRGLLYADRPDPEGRLAPRGPIYTAPLPADHSRANTALTWAGQTWIQVLTPLSRDVQEQRRLALHEAFHRIQDDLGLTGQEAGLEHLDTPSGRATQRLEWRALALALTTTGPDSLEAMRDARLFRRQRQADHAPGAAGEFRVLRNEGMAEYTGIRLAYDDAAGRMVELLDIADGWDSMPRQFAYASGPAWGLLLDRHLPGWRQALMSGDTLDELIDQVLPPPADLTAWADRASHYGGNALLAQEARRAEARQAERERLVGLLMSDQALVLPLRQMRMDFDYTDLVPLPPYGTVYRTLTVGDHWGRIVVQSGHALINGDFTELRVPAAADGQAHTGPGWTLELVPGWRIQDGRLQATD